MQDAVLKKFVGITKSKLGNHAPDIIIETSIWTGDAGFLQGLAIVGPKC